MGVTGLWRLIEPSGKPVPVETLENKVLAVDISIWLHQVVKGYQDTRGAPMPNAHLMGLFQRLCKLLYFKIKPVFVFDGAFPELKRETIAKRQDSKIKYNSESERIKRELFLLLSKKTALGNILGKQLSPKKTNRSNSLQTGVDDDIFKLPALPEREVTDSESDEESSSSSTADLHSVDIESEKFKNMPLKEKYDMLIELKETRKMNSWGKINELPKKSDNFSDFQMKRLLKRRKVQECLEETEKEMGSNCMSLNELEAFLNEGGIDTKIESLATHRIASSDTTRFLYIKDVKKALEDAKKQDYNQVENDKKDGSSGNNEVNYKEENQSDELDEDTKKAIQMSLECMEHNTSITDSSTLNNTSKSEESMDSSFMLDTDYSDTDDDSYMESDMSSAKAYIMQYTDFNHRIIDKIVSNKQNSNSNKDVSNKVENILKELDEQKPIITDDIDLSGSEEEDNAFISNNKYIDLDTTDDQQMSGPAKDLNRTESSVMCIEESNSSIITLESSVENAELQTIQECKKQDTEKSIKENIQEVGSDSDDDDFEEVLQDSHLKTVVQVDLNTVVVPQDDDIFADVFLTNKEENKVILNNCQILNEKCSEITKVEDVCENIIDSETKKSKNTKITVVNMDGEGSTSTTISNKMPEELLKKSKEPLSKETLNAMAETLDKEEDNLLQEKGRLDRIGRNITEQMTKEVQELLRMFGIPYIVAPMEAEAQCAFLETVKLTDGTITDDSDIWLFGGQTVYKNFFNQKKHVLQFLAERIKTSYNLSREKLVLLALLVGSDYTTGVNGVGPVTALEILASFPYNKIQLSTKNVSNQVDYSKLVSGLQEFKNWVRTGKRTDNTALKKKLRNVQVTDDFPSTRVVQAYFEPNIETSKDNFTWGELDITVLRDYTKTKFGWSQSKLDEIIKPVIKRLVERKSQKNIQDYFKRKVEFQCLEEHMSKRVKAAVQKMGPEGSHENEITSANANKRKGKRKLTKRDKGKEIESSDSESTSKIADKRKRSIFKKLNVTETITNPNVEIHIPKTNYLQEIIPQREKDRKCVLETKLKAIEIYRKSKIDKKTNKTKKRPNLPKEKAELSESDTD